MEEQNVGVRFHKFGKWYDEIVEIIDKRETVALIKYKTDYNEIFFAHVKKENDGLWHPFISGRYLDRGLLYPYFDEIEHEEKDDREF